MITWDDRKNEANQKKHGVSFEEAASVLSNPLTLTDANHHPSGNRMHHIGYSWRGAVLFVVTVDKSDDEIRIISARKATANERKQYEDGI